MGGHTDEFERPGPYDMFNRSALSIERKQTMNIRTVILSVGLALVFLFAARLAIANTKVVDEPSSQPAGVVAAPGQTSNQNNSHIPSYRSRLADCFDVPLREAAACQNTSEPAAPSYRSRVDECFDVPLSELASCRDGSRALAP